MAIPQEAEHIYLEVVHIQSGPLPADKGKLNGASPFTGIEQGSPKRSCSSLNIVLAAMVVILGVLCCLFLVLYVTEKAQSCEDARFETRHSTSTAKGSGLDCKTIRSEMTKNKFAYETLKCSADECTATSFLFHRRNASDYVISMGSPRMNAITACFWVKQNLTSGHAYYVSYHEAQSEDGFGVCEPEWDARKPRMKNVTWHSFCWTWSSLDGRYHTYQDGMIVEEGEFRLGRPFVGGGKWVLGGHAESVSGEEAPSNSAEMYGEMLLGEITAVNIWNKVLPRSEILQMSKNCLSKYQGNVKSMDDFKSGARGEVRLVERPACCTAESSMLF